MSHPTQGNSDTTPDTSSATPDPQVVANYLDYDEPQGFDPLTPITLADASRTPVIVEYGDMRKERLTGLDAALDRIEELMLKGFTVHSVRFLR